MKKYSATIQQRLDESAVLGQEVFSNMESPDFKGFVSTMALVMPELTPIVKDWDKLKDESSGKGARLFKKDVYFFLDVNGFGVYEIKIDMKKR